MKQWLAVILLVCVTCFGFSDRVEAEAFRHSWYKVNLKYDEDIWTPSNDMERYQLLALLHEDGVTSLNVFAYTYAETPTINGFQERRKVSGYDGWVNLGERVGTEFESKRANVQDSYLSIYSKKSMNAQLQVESWVVAEYYYVKENKGYVVSIRTRRELWKSVQETFKEVVESFWVGDGEKPKVARVKTSETDWEMVGANPENQNSNDVSFDPQSKAAFSWEFRSDYDLKGGAPLFAKGAIYAAEDGRIRSFSIYDGVAKWEYETSGDVDAPMAYQNGRLFFIEKTNDSSMLKVLSASKGHLTYELPLVGSDFMAPVVVSGRVLLAGGNALTAYSDTNGQKLWDFSVPEGVSFYPICSRDYIVLVEGGKKLHLIQGKNGAPYWSQFLSGTVAAAPMINKDMLILPQLKTDSSGSYVSFTALNLAQGSEVWSFDAKGYSTTLVSPPSVSQGLYFVTLRREDREHLLAIDVNTGEVAWGKDWPRLGLEYGAQPAVTGTGIYRVNGSNLSAGISVSVLNNRNGTEDYSFTVDLPEKGGRGDLRFLKVYKSALFFITDKGELEIISAQ